MFSCWMYFYEILTRTKADKQAFLPYQCFWSLRFFLITQKSHSTCSLIGKLFVRECVCVCMCVCVHAPWAASITPAVEKTLLYHNLLHLDLLSVGFQFAHWPEILMAVFICITNQLLDFFFFFKQLFETTTGILSTISWKFVIVCLKYDCIL